LIASPALAAQPLRCLIEADAVAEVGSPVIGVVEAVHVERGDFVRKGQLLARLRADVERASVDVARANARANADLRGAQASYDFLSQKLSRGEELLRQNFISQQGLEQMRAEARVAEQRLAQAKEQQRAAQHQLELAQAQLTLRSITAPFAGIVAERFVTVGERVEERPMFRLARIDPLRVEVIVPAALYGSVRKGMLAGVTPDLPNAAAVDAKIVLVDKLIDAASNTFRVRAELPNKDLLVPSGLRCKAELKEPAEAKPASTSEPGGNDKVHVQPANLKLDASLSPTKERPR
jgi:RND family efflux transporter MFP subunit